MKMLSIVIPTKDRYSTLLPVLNSLLQIDSDELEIVIQDNSVDNHKILEYLKVEKDHRIKYFYCSDSLSQSSNSDLAIRNSIGDYVCFIGDDDAVMPYIMDVIKWMERQNIKIIKSYKPLYCWPGMQDTYTSKNLTGVLKSASFTYKVERLNCSKGLLEVLNKGGTDISPLPCLYHGIVERSVLEKILVTCKSFFPGPSPDMANAVALSIIEEYFVYVDFPIVISGKSTNSIGGKGILHKHVSKIEEVKHLPPETAAKWSKVIPRYWTGPTIWAESLLKSLEACGRQEMRSRFNTSYLFANLILFHYRDKDKIFKDYPRPIYSFNFFKAFIYLFVKRTKMFFKNRVNSLGITSYSNVKTISEAIKILSDNVDYKQLPF